MGVKPKIILVLVTLLVLDRLLKIVLLKNLLASQAFFNWYPRLTLHQNYGVAFDLAVPHMIIVVMSVLLVILVGALFIKIQKKQVPLAIALAFIFVGAVSNLYDRIFYGFVIDTIELFPRSIWNIADVLILFGLIRIVFMKKNNIT